MKAYAFMCKALESLVLIVYSRICLFAMYNKDFVANITLFKPMTMLCKIENNPLNILYI